MARLLIAEDEQRIASFLAKGLTAEGHQTTIADDGALALHLSLSGSFDLVILDIGLPTMDGFEVLTRMRGGGVTIPVIVLTARDSVAVSVLEGGADDYMSKPFSFAELLARVRLRLRQTTTATVPEESISVGGVELDRRTRRAVVGGKDWDLSAREFVLAEIFMINAGQVLSREQLLDHAWGYDFDPGSNVVDVYVGYLRKKLGADRITTVRGMGYRFNT